MKILIDTNMLLVPHQFGVDIYEFLKEYEMVTLSSCVDELKKLSRKRGDGGVLMETCIVTARLTRPSE